MTTQALENIKFMIRILRAEAGNAGDGELVADCDAALDGDREALARVTRIMLDAASEAAA